MAAEKTYSVIIPNTNSLLIGKILQQLRHQTIDLSLIEVLVVGVDKPGLVTEDDVVRFIPTGEHVVHASDKRNLGMQAAQGDLFLFLDDDCLPTPDWIACHVARHQAGEKIVGGAVTFGARHLLQLADNVSAFHDLLPFTRAGTRPYLATANLSVARSVVEHAGMLRPGKSRAEDLEWTARFRACGYRLYFEPSAVVFHDPARHTPAAIWRHWAGDAADTLWVRLRYADLLNTPSLARYRPIYLWGAPLVAAWATARTFSHPRALLRYGHTLPLVYLTKLIWCWGAFKGFPRNVDEVSE